MTWWRLGGDNKLEKLVFLKLKSLNLLKKAHIACNRFGGLLENKYGEEDERNFHLGFSCGAPVDNKTATGLRVAFNNDVVN